MSDTIMMALACFTAHSTLNAGHGPGACRSEVSFDAAGCRSEIAMRGTCASGAPLDDRVEAGRAGFVAQTSCEPPHRDIRAAHSHINLNADSEQPELSSARHLPINIHGVDAHWRPEGRLQGADGSMGRTGGWGGRDLGWGGREPGPGADGSMGRKGGWGRADSDSEYGAERRTEPRHARASGAEQSMKGAA